MAKRPLAALSGPSEIRSCRDAHFGVVLVSVKKLAPYAGADSAAIAVTIVASGRITLIATDPCAIGNASETLPAAHRLEPAQRR